MTSSQRYLCRCPSICAACDSCLLMRFPYRCRFSATKRYAGTPQWCFYPAGSSESKGAAVDEAIQDFRARVAELNFHSEHVPLVVLLCVTPGEGDLERLQEFAGAAKLRTGAPVRVVEAGDDSEDGLILTVIDIAELLRRHKGGWSRIVDSSGGRRRSQCCALV
ncbi:unnamed protein product [Prorocentrum cordatum]|uniref:Uncharacterized protein n=1 Tax=Prorocentrum cordatum TaxID=2364126 RepID=A0ABN9SQM8_9DINO|nr:unnamed protein product [Polarella glacialis]